MGSSKTFAFGSRLFWSLPYQLRQQAFRAIWPRKYEDLVSMRTPDENGDYPLKRCDEMKCIFVHIPKTGGISVATALFGHHAGTHTSLRRYQFIYSAREYADYFKFGFVRNPWGRLYSAWSFLQKGGLYKDDAAWFEANLKTFPDFDGFVRDWVNRENIYRYRHFVPQYRFLQGVTICPDVDFVGRFENLDEDFGVICERLELSPAPNLKKLNVSSHRPDSYRDHYSDEAAAIVGQVYREDIELFGYDF